MEMPGSLLDRQTEQTKPISTIRLWQKQAARKSTLSWVGTEMSWRMAGGGKNDIFGLMSETFRAHNETTAYHHVLEQCISPFNLHICAASKVGCLLQEDVLGSEDLANVDCHFLEFARRS